MNEVSPPPPRLMTPRRATIYLQDEYGIELKITALAQQRCRGGGPAFRKWGSRKILYAEDDLRVWAETQLGPRRFSTREGVAA